MGIKDINPTSAKAPLRCMKKSGLDRKGGRERIVQCLETKPGGFSVHLGPSKKTDRNKTGEENDLAIHQ